MTTKPLILTSATVNKTDGTEAISVDASGNVGIGTTSPANILTVQKSTGDCKVAFNSSVGTQSSYGVFVNTTVTTVGTENSTGGNLVAGSAAYSTVLANNGAYPISFGTNNTERVRIDASGNLLVGTTGFVANNEARLTVVNKTGDVNNRIINLKANSTTIATTMIGFYDGTDTFQGQIYCDTNANTTTYATSSDYRLKDDIQLMVGALDKIKNLKPCIYSWKNNGAKGQGFIAHELQEIVPEAVIGEKDAVNDDGSINPQMIDPSKLVALLTAAIQEQQALIQSLEARLAALESK